MIRFLSFWYSKIVLRFLTDNEKIMYRNLERNTLKLERNKFHLMFNETCYNNNILPTYTNIFLNCLFRCCDSSTSCWYMFGKISSSLRHTLPAWRCNVVLIAGIRYNSLLSLARLNSCQW